MTASAHAHGDHAGVTLVTSKNYFQISLREAQNEAYSPEGHPTGHFKASGGRFCRETRVRKRCVKSICTIRRFGTQFRSELASICVSEAEAFTYERECSSASFLLVFTPYRDRPCIETKKNWLSPSAHGDDIELFSQSWLDVF